MHGEIPPLYELCRAYLAAVSLHAAMSFQMPAVVKYRDKPGATLCTLSQLLSVVDSPVDGDTLLLREGAIAEVTAEQLLAGVSEPVSGQVVYPGEGLAADVTAVRPLPRVGHPMLPQGVPVVCRVFTPLAPVFAVSADVAVPPLHVGVQLMPLQTREVAVSTVYYAFRIFMIVMVF